MEPWAVRTGMCLPEEAARDPPRLEWRDAMPVCQTDDARVPDRPCPVELVMLREVLQVPVPGSPASVSVDWLPPLSSDSASDSASCGSAGLCRRRGVPQEQSVCGRSSSQPLDGKLYLSHDRQQMVDQRWLWITGGWRLVITCLPGDRSPQSAGNGHLNKRAVGARRRRVTPQT